MEKKSVSYSANRKKCLGDGALLLLPSQTRRFLEPYYENLVDDARVTSSYYKATQITRKTTVATFFLQEILNYSIQPLHNDLMRHQL